MREGHALVGLVRKEEEHKKRAAARAKSKCSVIRYSSAFPPLVLAIHPHPIQLPSPHTPPQRVELDTYLAPLSGPSIYPLSARQQQHLYTR